VNRKIRLGIVGAGKIVRAEHIPRFRSIESVELVAVANRSADSSKRAAAELGISRWLDDWRDLVADPEIDAVLVGAWPYLHAPVTLAALEAGKHVLTEARMAATGAEAREMLRVSQARPDLVAMVVPASFSLWADATIRRLLAEGAVGPLRHLRVTWHSSGPEEPGEGWRWQRRFSGENVMALGIVYEAMARWLGRATAVMAESRIDRDRAVDAAVGGGEIDIPDHVQAILEFPADVTATIEMSARTQPIASNTATFFGSGGTIEVDFAAQRIRHSPVSGDCKAVEIRDEDRAGWTAEVDFVASIRDGRPVKLTDFATGAHYMAVVEAVDRSAAKGRRVPVEAVDAIRTARPTAAAGGST
jgi:predicted dehydrogenase